MSAMLTMADTEHSLSYKNNNEIYQEEIIMSKIYTSADQLIGKTPLLELTQIENPRDLTRRSLRSWNISIGRIGKGQDREGDDR